MVEASDLRMLRQAPDTVTMTGSPSGADLPIRMTVPGKQPNSLSLTESRLSVKASMIPDSPGNSWDKVFTRFICYHTKVAFRDFFSIPKRGYLIRKWHGD